MFEKISRILNMAVCVILVGMVSCVAMDHFMPEKPEPAYYQKIDGLPVFDLGDVARNEPGKQEPIISLFEKEKDQEHFLCTAFVVSDKLAFTAAHCLVDEQGFMKKSDIIVKDTDFKNPSVAKAGAINVAADMGVIVGDFSKHNKFLVSLKRGFFGFPGPFASCGFAWGDNPMVCIPFMPASNRYFQVQGQGALFPGMSGGPVIDMSSGAVVGINAAAGDGVVVITPTLGILGALELQIKSP